MALKGNRIAPNGSVQIGNNSNANSISSPSLAIGLSRVQEIVAGAITSCTRMADFKFKCWGKAIIGAVGPFNIALT